MNLSKTDLLAAASAARQVSSDLMEEVRDYRDQFGQSESYSPDVIADDVDSAIYWRRLARRLTQAAEEA